MDNQPSLKQEVDELEEQLRLKKEILKVYKLKRK